MTCGGHILACCNAAALDNVPTWPWDHRIGCKAYRPRPSTGPHSTPSQQRRLSGLLRDGAKVVMAIADTLDEMAAAPEVKP